MDVDWAFSHFSSPLPLLLLFSHLNANAELVFWKSEGIWSTRKMKKSTFRQGEKVQKGCLLFTAHSALLLTHSCFFHALLTPLSCCR
jgi:hypothetical protein